MSNYKKLSVIIVNYQSEHYLEKCLTSLLVEKKARDEEIIIVNNDKKETLEKIRERFPLVKILELPENKGFGSACNWGAKNSQGELILFLNPDTEILVSLDPIIKAFEENTDVGAIGPKLLGENGKTQEWSTGVEISLLDLIGNNLGLSRSKRIWESPEVRETFWISGAALFVSRKIFFQAGGFDEAFFLYFEDNDLCHRIRKIGKRLLYFPKVAILHLGGKSSRKSQKQKEYFFASQDYYFKKHFGNFQVFWLRLLRKIFLKRQRKDV
jgi:N-acetylglucosaminyl-diphospho-decaprenol L-rhamnosyltransferase